MQGARPQSECKDCGVPMHKQGGKWIVSREEQPRSNAQAQRD